MIGFSDELINWYLTNKRDLPWRNTSDPYKIWLSEVILQQTRVQQGLDYFLKFVEQYPTIDHLAQASEHDVLLLWQGLGYYSRARNMRYTALEVQNKYQGRFPTSFSDLIGLKGIGPYTAAAVASFASNEHVAVVDGNVYRVLARIFGVYDAIDSTLGKKNFQLLANSLLGSPSSLHNQAIMEFGALVCTPKAPHCNTCIFNTRCEAFRSKTSVLLPIKGKKTKVKTRYFNYLVATNNDNLHLKLRTAGDIWQGLYDFPLIESNKQINSSGELMAHPDFSGWNQLNPEFTGKSQVYRHLLSHREILATFWELNVAEPNTQYDQYLTKVDNTGKYPVPQLIANYLKDKKSTKK